MVRKCIFTLLLILFIGIINVQGEIITKDFASQVALSYCTKAFNSCEVIDVNTYYALDDSPYYYIVTLGLTTEADDSIKDTLPKIKAIFDEKVILDREGADRSLIRDKEIEMSFFNDYARVIVSTTTDRNPVLSIKRGLPIHIIRFFDVRQVAKTHFGVNAKFLKNYVTGSYDFSAEFQDGKEHVLVNYFKLNVEYIEDVKRRKETSQLQKPKLEDLTEEEKYKYIKQLFEKGQRIQDKWDFLIKNKPKKKINEYEPRLNGLVPRPRGGSNEIPTHSDVDYTQSELGLSNECYIAAATSILGYWDDHSHDGGGPWERIVQNGNASCSSCMFNLAQELKAADNCAQTGTYCYFTDCFQDMMNYVTDTVRGLSFTYDEDCLAFITWRGDYKNEIDDGKPVHYSVWGHGFWSNHSVIGIGWREQDSPSTNWVRCYNNNWHGVDEIDWDAGTKNALVVANPGGPSLVDIYDFQATYHGSRLLFSWKLRNNNNVGFNILKYNKENDSYSIINDKLIRGTQYFVTKDVNGLLKDNSTLFFLEIVDIKGIKAKGDSIHVAR